MIRTPEVNELRFRIQLFEQQHDFAVHNPVYNAFEATDGTIHFVSYDEDEQAYFTGWINSEDHSPVPDCEGFYNDCVQYIVDNYDIKNKQDFQE